MSYRKKHIKSKIYKIKPKNPVFKKRWFWFSILFLVVISSAVYFLIFYSGVQVKNIIISGNQKVLGEDIQNLIASDINNKILSLGILKVESKSIFLINIDKLDKEILDEFPIIGGVEVNRKFFQTIEVKIYERLPVAAFCPSINYEENCFLIDKNGVAFESVEGLPVDNFIVRQDLGSSKMFAGERVVQANIMDLLLKLVRNLKGNFQIDLKTAIVISSLRLDVTTNESWKVYFDVSPDSDINSQIDKLNSLLSSGISPEDRKNLRYIDLRPKDRAIVCDNKECGG